VAERLRNLVVKAGADLGRGARAALLIAVATGLGGCYLPTDFDAMIQIAQDGRYVLNYRGQLTSVGLAKSLAQGTLSKQEAAERIQKTRMGLMRRDSAFRSVEYERQGRFRVDYESVGSLLQTPFITFVDSSSKFLIIKHLKKDGTVTVGSEKMKDQYVRELLKLGLKPGGTLRIRTDAKVLEHNADSVRGRRTREYLWKIKGFRGPPPKLVLQLMDQPVFPGAAD
jgi:hypothetical protein